MQVEALCAVMTGCKHRTPKPPPDPVYCSVGMELPRLLLIFQIAVNMSIVKHARELSCLYVNFTGVRNIVLQDLVREVNKTNIKLMLALLPTINYMEVHNLLLCTKICAYSYDN